MSMMTYALAYDPENPRHDEDPIEAAADVQRLYDSDVPFFTKDRIREANKSILENNEPGKTACIRDLDGRLTRFKVETGEVVNDSKDEEWICDSVLEYVCIQNLLDQERLGGHSPYSNLRLVHLLEPRSQPAGPEANQREIHASLERDLDLWRDSQSWGKLKATLRGVSIAPVKKIVAFGLGSMREMPPVNRHFYQHALILALRQLLYGGRSRRIAEKEIKCYAQDPGYTENDIAALQSCAVTAVPDPEGFLEVDEQTVVISIYPNVPIRQVISEISRPAVMIWNSIEGNGFGGVQCTDPDSPRLLRWIAEHYETLEFPHEPELFGELAVYVRRT
ncbi:hypothetical protein BJY00DRAFT_318582 [Aspergillus carlsbadensis]|nr:hypothetical protein BJY00DRAFT_318582 [Aspergillus carlsbadensis]